MSTIIKGVAYIFTSQKDREEFVKVAKEQEGIIMSRRWGKKGLIDHKSVYGDNLCYYVNSIGMLHYNHIDIIKNSGYKILTFKTN